jgi:hypothetical protein
MALSVATGYVEVAGNDVATSFSFSPVIIQDPTHLAVYLIDADGEATLVTRGSGADQYQVVVASYPGTGSITYPASGSDYLATGETLRIKRVVPLTQETQLGTEGGYSSVVQENTFDYGRMIDIQQQEEIDRSLKVPIGDDTDPADYLDTVATATAALATAGAEAAQAAAEAAQAAAEAAETNAETAETNAETAATNAQTAETNAETAATSAQTAETNAETAETNAEAAAAAAAASAVDAAASANAFYDTPFNAGYTSAMASTDLAVQTYGELVVGRAFTVTGERGYIGTVATGAEVIVDIEKNGTTIYTTKPEFDISANALTAGVLKTDGTEDFAAGDRMTFKVTQIGSTIKGGALRFTVLGAL